MSDNLRQKTKNGLIWSTVERFSNQSVGFVFSIILARLLCPSDYGIVAMITIFFAVAQAFVDSGFANALIRKNNRTEKDLSTCFYFNILVGLFAYIVFFIAAPWIANFYNQPILTMIIRLESVTMFLNSLCIVQQALLTIQINFKTQAKISLASTIMSGIIGVILAYNGFGVWALVWQGISNALVRMILLWKFSTWRPRYGFSKESFHYLFGYGSKLLASGLLDTTYNNIYPIIIGKLFTPADLGYFSRAQGLATLPSSNLTSVLQRVTFPVLSEIQDDMERLETNYRKLLKMSAFIIFPLMMLLAAIARPLVDILLTDKWDNCVIYLQILCVALMWHPIHAINLNLLQVKGRSDLFLRLEIIKKILGVIIILITFSMGLKAMCIGLAINSIIALTINTFYTGKLISIGFISQVKDLLPIILSSILLLIVSSGCVYFIENVILQIIVGTVIGIGCYVGVAILFRYNEIEYIKQFIIAK